MMKLLFVVEKVVGVSEFDARIEEAIGVDWRSNRASFKVIKRVELGDILAVDDTAGDDHREKRHKVERR